MRLPLLAALLAALTGLAVPLAAAAQVDPAPGKRRPVAPGAAPKAEDPVPATPEEMEARRSRVDAERKLQEKAFDDRVRRATTSICSGCTTGCAAPSRRARSAGAERDTAPSDPAEAPPLPTARP
ncbi:hypothetical protein [Methylobacterium oxalidis]|uniref:Uncharacterized protein n=1 Tax=Methylobacterium oxalidis TaxID=944322 RepID=A0A512J5E9_9HYPH|nr:hypothetical protein [Methylobacterium oxalidis]GEP05206.1 hypothetical protein MOX02_32440 [Methylobacterium oxalidis]GJE34206.1 hypothetical protein LDDCCGHA_4413 [Methylobacterium oxalidis]GLS66376.1 hypothetical protein GCM10007888_47590 [Methylobacterium oxalidis]